MSDLLDQLARDLVSNVGLDYGLASEIAEFLYQNDFVDYATLKEIYDYE